jgi:predicted MFS family arabinose efflux permease
MQPITRLTYLAFLTHAADQLALAALPLTAVMLFSATPGLVGTLVAAQSAAWLIVSLPMGVVIDRAPRELVMRGALMLCVAGAALAGLATWAGSLAALGLTSFVLASGTVIFVMAQVASLPVLVARSDLAATNARIETARALAMLAAPFIAGWCVAEIAPQAVYGLATLAALGGLVMSFSINVPDPARTIERASMLHSIREGARFVAGHDVLRSIAVCAICWNFAFFALIASFVPFALRHIGLSAAQAGFALGANGAGLLLGAVLAGKILAHVAPSVVLVAGPVVSTFGVALILASPRTGGLYAATLGFFLIGFGPMLWLIVQTSIRQLVTPPALMGRVTATIQVAIYGVRPIGALAAGFVGDQYGLVAALLLAVAGFALSFAVAALSPLARMRTLPASA